MDYFAGLDVSVKETSVCIVDDAGKIVREARVASEPEALLQVLANNTYRFKRVGLEAGPLSQWLYSVLAEAGLPAICVETRHMRAVLKALSTGACEDVTQPEASDAADPSQAASIEGHRHRERPACYVAQLRP
jgi:transposase